MNLEQRDYLIDMLDALQTETNERIEELRDKVLVAGDELTQTDNIIHGPAQNLHLYEPQTAEEFHRMERAVAQNKGRW